MSGVNEKSGDWLYHAQETCGGGGGNQAIGRHACSGIYKIRSLDQVALSSHPSRPFTGWLPIGRNCMTISKILL